MSVKVFVVDDHEVVRLGVRALLAESDLRISGEADSGEAALKLLARSKPDVVLLDIQMTPLDGFSTLIRLKNDNPRVPIVMYASSENPTYLARAMALKAHGIAYKTDERARLIATLKAAAAGEETWTVEEKRRVAGAGALGKSISIGGVVLRQRESEVLRQLTHGLTNKEIALALGISYETVKEHIQHLLRKIGVSDRTQAAVWAVRHE
jgi:DNA-binding NarL/FixJ family response regulator